MQSIQDTYFPNMNCFGCGPANAAGLQLKSYPADGGATATFAGSPQHDNGVGFLNGGIITTVLDCHSISPVLLYAEEQGLFADGVPLPFVTAGLDVRFVRPTPLGPDLTLFASIEGASPDEVWVRGELIFEDKVRATVKAQWKRWRPR
jgi:acyl-coenzyme A thioesterase PaaI-like protein